MRQRTYISTGGDANKIASYTNACFEYLCINRLNYLLTVHDPVCLHNLESRLLHNISSWFNLKLALQKLKWHVSTRRPIAQKQKKLCESILLSYSILTAKLIMILLRAILEIHCNWRYYPEKSPKKPSWAKHVRLSPFVLDGSIELAKFWLAIRLLANGANVFSIHMSVAWAVAWCCFFDLL